MNMTRPNAIALLTVLPTMLALTACSQHDDATDRPLTAGGTPRIGFMATVDASPAAATRATTDRGRGELTTELLQQKGFGVYCWYTGETTFDNFANGQTHIGDYLGTTGYMLMQNQEVSYDATASQPHWTYRPPKYWPLEPDEKLTLRAYAPYASYLVGDSRGLPQLPVMVRADDFCNDRQHDPLWGTSRHTAEELRAASDTYGEHYDNYTYAMSGTNLTADSRDGTIDWYFHHGMAKLVLQAMVQNPEPGTEVRVTQMVVSPLYDQGLLNIFTSRSAAASDKPDWTERSGNIGVTLAHGHANDPADQTAGTHNDLNGDPLGNSYTSIADRGLLVIPRDYTTAPLSVTVTYTETRGGVASEPQTATGTISLNIQGNTIYYLWLDLNVEENTLNIRSFINLEWQVGSYGLVDEL